MISVITKDIETCIPADLDEQDVYVWAIGLRDVDRRITGAFRCDRGESVCEVVGQRLVFANDEHAQLIGRTKKCGAALFQSQVPTHAYRCPSREHSWR